MQRISYKFTSFVDNPKTGVLINNMKKVRLIAIAELLILFISSCGGNSSSTSSSTATGTQSVISGAAVYNRTCVTCHQGNGAGIPGAYPPLAKSDFLANTEKTIAQVIKGYQGELMVNGVKYNNVMPPQPLNDDEVAAVLTYVNTSFGNNGASITTDEVKAVRSKLN
jgi:nitrite reductase (NO-forming)